LAVELEKPTHPRVVLSSRRRKIVDVQGGRTQPSPTATSRSGIDDNSPAGPTQIGGVNSCRRFEERGALCRGRLCERRSGKPGVDKRRVLRFIDP